MAVADRITELPASRIRKGTYPIDARLPIEKFMTEKYGLSGTVVR